MMSNPPEPVRELTLEEAKKIVFDASIYLHIVTAAALATEHTDIQPVSDPPPPWFDELKANLDTAKAHARQWVKFVPDVGSTIPAAVIDFGSTFKAAADQILSILEHAKNLDPKSAKYKQLFDEAVEYLEALRGQLTEIDTRVETAGARLADFQTLFGTDHQALVEGVNSIQKAEDNLLDDIIEIDTDIGKLESRIEFEHNLLGPSMIGLALGLLVLIAGIALTIVTGGAGAPIVAAIGGGLLAGAGLGGGIAIGVLMAQQRGEIEKKLRGKDKDKAQIMVLGALSASIKNLKTRNEDAQKALTAFREIWSTFDKTLDNILTKLKKAEDPLHVVLDVLWVNSAKNLWEELVNFAEAIEGTPVRTEDQGMVPLPKAS